MTSVEDVPEIIEEIGAITPGISSDRNLGLFFGGVIIGSGIGAAIGFVVSRRMLETKYNQIAEDEIAVMRDHYHSKLVAHENTTEKEKLEDIVRDQGYTASISPPMAVAPPAAVVEAAEDDEEDEEDEEDALSENEVFDLVEEPTQIRNVFKEAEVVNNWNYHKERARRSPVRPYVIHIDERQERPYEEVSLTYFEGDDVLCDEREEVISNIDRDRMIGEDNLEKFGHGSNDPSIVYIRNDKMEAQYEIVKSPNSYAQEVHGFEHADTRNRRRGRLTYDDE